MRAPASDKPAEITVSERGRQPSVPDHVSRSVRRNVKEMMRQPSTPWIVFDRRSKLELGLADTELGAPAPMFPAGQAAPAHEPSSVVVAADVGVDASSTTEALALDADALDAALPVSRGNGWKVAAALALGLAALGVAKAAITTPTADASVPVASVANASRAPEPARLDLASIPPADLASSEPAAPPATAKPEAAAKESRYGRLSIRGAARHHRVYIDGKLLLGAGKRSFNMVCGAHTIAVGSKGTPRDVEIPCNGELVVSK
jgi:hypothetical protein